MITFQRPDGKSSSAYLVEPVDAKNAPGVVVIQEWWGLDDEIKNVANRLADSGYRALVPDLYRGKLALEANEAEHLMNDLNFADAASQDIRGAVQYLKQTGSNKVAVTGFCMGGALTVLSAELVPESDGTVVWYGYPPLEYVDAAAIKKPMLAHWALHDDFFSIAGVDQLEEKLKVAGVSYDFQRYDAKHAFANPRSDSRGLPPLQYNPAAAQLAWERTMTFLNNTLNN
ncbi:MAG: carboxymethylenebutenolidase [Polynucleobacter sp. 24-46-87]|jgi:carboxymethylenebutenolidase|uniref:dienelactone hydrolase family protein n=1 Tax=Polynucleobacter sp. 35-46-11 TaxID=1970425 RepID=UPI000BCA7F27|nr:dienelactone hydrolase family protein [Polynucleobacter sp. 35-46-11]OYY11701.1 MAG: carboxymethylenebutenolidase [Polynucleobacter sp. 35-46-11]OZA15719.1 MAG: carboxymethylenebutenolidase [Polynucleobacter sp. 24-46-87]